MKEKEKKLKTLWKSDKEQTLETITEISRSRPPFIVEKSLTQAPGMNENRIV